MKGSTYKRCKCRDADGRELGKKCAKLRRKDGSWNPRHGTWYFRLELDAGHGGKRRTVRRGGYETQDDAQDGLDEAKKKAGHGVDISKKVTLAQHLDEWLKGKKRTRRNTNRGYESVIRVHLKPHLGHLELGKLRVDHVTEMFDAIEHENQRVVEANAERARLRSLAKKAGRARDHKARLEALAAIRALPRGRRPTGPVTKQRIRDVLRNALNAAIAQGLISVNVAELVELESVARAKPVIWTAERVRAWRADYDRVVAEERQAAEGRAVDLYRIWRGLPRPSKVMVWNPQQTAMFLEYAAKHRLYATYHLIAFTGLRRGEACGAAWADLDWDAQELAIRTQLIQLGWQVEEGAPKTEASDAHVALDKGTVDALRAHRLRQHEDQVALDDAWIDSGKLFTQEDGSPLHPATLTAQSSVWPTRRGSRLSGCTTSAMARPPWRSPPAST